MSQIQQPPYSIIPWKGTSKPKKIENFRWSYFVAPEKLSSKVIWLLIFEFFLTKLQPPKEKRSECPKFNHHHTVVYLGKAVTSKPKNIANRGCFYFLAPEKFFPTVIWFLIFKFFLMKLLPTTVKGLECPKSTNIRIFGYPDYFQADFFISWLNIFQMHFLIQILQSYVFRINLPLPYPTLAYQE